MKKIYKIPETTTWMVETITMLATSDPAPSVNPGTPANPEDPLLVKRRDVGNVWDDDWSR